MQRIPEQTTFAINASFYDPNAATIPSTVRYRLTDEISRTELVGWTDLTPAAVVTIIVSATSNAIVNVLNSVERRLLTVQADYGLDTEWSDDFEYEVSRLSGLH